MIAITVDQTGLDQVVARVTRVELFLRDPITECRAELIAWFRALQAKIFTTQGGSGASGRWEPLSPTYARAKARQFPGRTILERSGRLRASLQVETSDSIIESSVRRLVLGSAVPYARFPQRGEGQPRRSPIDITNQDAGTVAMIIRRRLARVVSGELAGAAA